MFAACFLTHLGTIVTSGARRTTGSSWASNAGSTTLTGSTSVTLRQRGKVQFYLKAEELHLLWMGEKGRRNSLWVQMGHRVQPHRQHPEQKKDDLGRWSSMFMEKHD